MRLVTSSQDVTAHTLCLHFASLQPTLRVTLLNVPLPQSHQRVVELRAQRRCHIDHVLDIHLDSEIQRGAVIVTTHSAGQDKVKQVDGSLDFGESFPSRPRLPP